MRPSYIAAPFLARSEIALELDPAIGNHNVVVFEVNHDLNPPFFQMINIDLNQTENHILYFKYFEIYGIKRWIAIYWTFNVNIF